MGGHHSHGHKTGQWSTDYGCNHFDEDTVITTLIWKTVPMTKEEKKVVLRRMTTITSSSGPATRQGLNTKEIASSQDAIEVQILFLIIPY